MIRPEIVVAMMTEYGNFASAIIEEEFPRYNMRCASFKYTVGVLHHLGTLDCTPIFNSWLDKTMTTQEANDYAESIVNATSSYVTATNDIESLVDDSINDYVDNHFGSDQTTQYNAIVGYIGKAYELNIRLNGYMNLEVGDNSIREVLDSYVQDMTTKLSEALEV